MRPEIRVMLDSVEWVERVVVDLDAAREELLALRAENRVLTEKLNSLDGSATAAVIASHEEKAAILEREIASLSGRLVKIKSFVVGKDSQ